MVVPLAIHFALNARRSVERRRWLLCVAVLVGVVPLTVSRSGLLTLLIGVAIYGAILTRRARANLIVLSMLGLVFFPRSLQGSSARYGTSCSPAPMTTASPDASTTTSTFPASSTAAGGLVAGFATFEPTVYFFLDNQYPDVSDHRWHRWLIVLFVDHACRSQCRPRSAKAVHHGRRTAIWPRRSPQPSSRWERPQRRLICQLSTTTFVLFLLGGCGAALGRSLVTEGGSGGHRPAGRKPQVGLLPPLAKCHSDIGGHGCIAAREPPVKSRPRGRASP